MASYERQGYDITLHGQQGETWGLYVNNSNFMLSSYNGIFNESGVENVSMIYYMTNSVKPIGTIEAVFNGVHCHETLIDDVSKDDFSALTPKFYLSDYEHTFAENYNTIEGRFTFTVTLELPNIKQYENFVNHFLFAETTDFDNDKLHIEYYYDRDALSIYSNQLLNKRVVGDYTIYDAEVQVWPKYDFGQSVAYFQFLGDVMEITFNTRYYPQTSILDFFPKNVVITYPNKSCTLHVYSVQENNNVPYTIEFAEDVFTSDGNVITIKDRAITTNVGTTFTISNGYKSVQGYISYIYKLVNSDSLEIYLYDGEKRVGEDLTRLTEPPKILLTSPNSGVDYTYVEEDGYYHVPFDKSLTFEVVYKSVNICNKNSWIASLNNLAKPKFDLNTNMATQQIVLSLNSLFESRENNRLYVTSEEEDWYCIMHIDKDLDIYDFDFKISGSSNNYAIGTSENTFTIISTKTSKNDGGKTDENFVLTPTMSVYYNEGRELSTLEEILQGEALSLDALIFESGTTQFVSEFENGTTFGVASYSSLTVANNVEETSDGPNKVASAFTAPYIIYIKEEYLSNFNKNGKYYFVYEFDQNISDKKLYICLEYESSVSGLNWLVSTKNLTFYRGGSSTPIQILAYCLVNGTAKEYNMSVKYDNTTSPQSNINSWLKFTDLDGKPLKIANGIYDVPTNGFNLSCTPWQGEVLSSNYRTASVSFIYNGVECGEEDKIKAIQYSAIDTEDATTINWVIDSVQSCNFYITFGFVKHSDWTSLENIITAMGYKLEFGILLHNEANSAMTSSITYTLVQEQHKDFNKDILRTFSDFEPTIEFTIRDYDEIITDFEHAPDIEEDKEYTLYVNLSFTAGALSGYSYTKGVDFKLRPQYVTLSNEYSVIMEVPQAEGDEKFASYYDIRSGFITSDMALFLNKECSLSYSAESVTWIPEDLEGEAERLYSGMPTTFLPRYASYGDASTVIGFSADAFTDSLFAQSEFWFSVATKTLRYTYTMEEGAFEGGRHYKLKQIQSINSDSEGINVNQQKLQIDTHLGYNLSEVNGEFKIVPSNSSDTEISFDYTQLEVTLEVNDYQTNKYIEIDPNRTEDIVYRNKSGFDIKVTKDFIIPYFNNDANSYYMGENTLEEVKSTNIRYISYDNGT